MPNPWTHFDAPDGTLPKSALSVVQTLYEYDEPLIFSSMFGPVKCLFIKVNEVEKYSIYLGCEVDANDIDHLQSGRVSVFGILDVPQFWIVSSNPESAEIAYWRVEHARVPPEFFPKPGTGLYHWHGSVPDSVMQAESLLSLKFKGPALKHSGMPLGKLKALVDQSHRSIRNLLTPLSLLNTKSSTFDVEVAPLRFASLVISARKPVLNNAAIKRNRPDVDLTKVEGEFFQRSADISKKLGELARIRGTASFDRQYATDNFSFLSAIADLLPDEDGFLSSTEINAQGANGMEILRFDKSEASQLRGAIDEASQNTVTEVGTIGGYIEKSQTVRLRSLRGKEVTCHFRVGEYERLTNDAGFRKGASIKIFGKLTIRPKVDYMNVEDYDLL